MAVLSAEQDNNRPFVCGFQATSRIREECSSKLAILLGGDFPSRKEINQLNVHQKTLTH